MEKLPILCEAETTKPCRVGNLFPAKSFTVGHGGAGHPFLYQFTGTFPLLLHQAAESRDWASLVVQWLRVHLAMQGTLV